MATRREASAGGHVRPGAPVAHVVRNGQRVVDPDPEGASGPDDHVRVSRERRERLGVVHAARHWFFGFHLAAGAVRRDHAGRLALTRLDRKAHRPRPRRLSRERTQQIGRRVAPERAREAHCLGATVEPLRGGRKILLAFAVRLDQGPIHELGANAEAESSRAIERALHEWLPALPQAGRVRTKSDGLAGCVPTEEIRARIVTVARCLHGAHHRVGRVLESAVGKIVEAPAELREQILCFGLVEQLSGSFSAFGSAVGRDQLRQEPRAQAR